MLLLSGQVLLLPLQPQLFRWVLGSQTKHMFVLPTAPKSAPHRFQGAANRGVPTPHTAASGPHPSGWAIMLVQSNIQHWWGDQGLIGHA